MSSDINQNESSETPETNGEQPIGEFSNGEENVVIAEPKTPVNRSTIVTFVILVLGAASVYFMYRQTGPAKAGAAVTKETADAKKTISTFLSGGDTSIKSMQKLLKDTQKIVQKFLTYPSMTQIPLGDLHTNPFREHLENKAQNTDISDAELKKKQEAERQAVLKAVQGLQLQSIICGDTRKACMINTTLYVEGQSFDNFTVEKISPASVIVKNGSYRFELRMQR